MISEYGNYLAIHRNIKAQFPKALILLKENIHKAEKENRSKGRSVR